MVNFLSDYYVPWIVGLLFSVLLGYWQLGWVSRKMWLAIDLDPGGQVSRPSPWQPKAQGIVERALFTPAILTGNASFIAVWLALKVATQWTSWGVTQPGSTVPSRTVSGREVYVNFMLGTGLSIAFAAVGAYIVRLLQSEQVTPAALLAVSLVVATFAFGFWVEREGCKFLTQNTTAAA